jgi:hypothetical protein
MCGCETREEKKRRRVHHRGTEDTEESTEKEKCKFDKSQNLII